MSAPRATHAQWRTLGSLARRLGYRSATHLAATLLARTEREVRTALPRADASRAITEALEAQARH